MSIRTKLSMKLSIAALALASVTTAAFAADAAKPTRIRGDIVALFGDTLTVHRKSGDTVKIAVKADTPVTALKNIKLQDITSQARSSARLR